MTEGPMCPGPVAIGDNTCPDQPYQATISVLDINNKLITQLATDRSGYLNFHFHPEHISSTLNLTQHFHTQLISL